MPSKRDQRAIDKDFAKAKDISAYIEGKYTKKNGTEELSNWEIILPYSSILKLERHSSVLGWLTGTLIFLASVQLGLLVFDIVSRICA